LTIGLTSFKVSEIPVNKIKPNNFNLREIDENVVRELTESIKSSGLLQPIMVRSLGDNFEIIFGLHRFEACRRLGWERIPAVVINLSDEEAFLTCVIENLQRNIRINPVSEAEGYRTLISRGWTIHDIAQKIGKSDSYVYERLRILDGLHKKIKEKLVSHVCKDNPITPSHAERLALIKNKRLQLKLAKLIKEKGLSVRQLERLTAKVQTKMPKGCLCPKCPNYPCKYIPESREGYRRLLEKTFSSFK